MILPDVNVLIYAFRDDAPQHRLCKHWLEEVASRDERFGISPLALNGLVRITTNKKISKPPTPVKEAFAFCDALLAQPNCEIVLPGDRHWSIFRRLCTDTDTTGPAVSDAWFAALAIEHGCTWITFDRDFVRFPGLDWREPAI